MNKQLIDILKIYTQFFRSYDVKTSPQKIYIVITIYQSYSWEVLLRRRTINIDVENRENDDR